MKDRFSEGSRSYAAFRPGYPEAMVEFVLQYAKGRRVAWDCGTGNGQFASLLAPHFEQVWATDMSAAQLAAATAIPNVAYSRQVAEGTDFPDGSVDLITVAQAIHWFDFEGFYAEVRRVAAREAVLAVIGYPLLRIDAEVDAVLDDFYAGVLGGYWDKERHFLDEEYRTIPFPFEEWAAPRFESTYEWTFGQFMGYLGTWSAVKNCIRLEGANPLAAAEPGLQAVWGVGKVRRVRFPMILRIGRVS